MAIQGVWAEKNGKKRFFTQRSWDLLGRDKNGWVALPDVQIENKLSKPNLQKPDTGDKKTQTIENKLDAKNKPDAKAKDKVLVSKEQKEDFRNAAKGLNKTDIKDYFDRQFPAVEYKADAGLPALVDQLGDQLKWDVVEVEKQFK